MNTRLSILIGLCTLLLAVAAVPQIYPSFPGAEIDSRTLRVQEQVEELYSQGAYERAYFIYRNELAPRGDKYAQYMVGYMHLTGTGLAEEPSVALAWYRLAAERNEPAIVQARDELEQNLNPPQIAAAELLFAELQRELSDRVLIFNLIRKDLKILRDSAASGAGRGTGPMTVIGRRYGYMSGAQYYERIKNRLEARLNYLKGQVDIIHVGPETAELADIESEMQRLFAEIKERQ